MATLPRAKEAANTKRGFELREVGRYIAFGAISGSITGFAVGAVDACESPSKFVAGFVARSKSELPLEHHTCTDSARSYNGPRERTYFSLLERVASTNMTRRYKQRETLAAHGKALDASALTKLAFNEMAKGGLVCEQ